MPLALCHFKKSHVLFVTSHFCDFTFNSMLLYINPKTMKTSSATCHSYAETKIKENSCQYKKKETICSFGLLEVLLLPKITQRIKLKSGMKNPENFMEV